MKKIELTEDIFLYENFITDEEIDGTLKVLDYLDKTREGFWMPISFYESYSSGYPEDGDPCLTEFGLTSTWFSDLRDKMRLAASEVARKQFSDMSQISFHSQRWLPGAFAPYHSDNSDEQGNMGAFTRSRYAGFLYLNDDFEGGELVFKNHNNDDEMIVVPKKGTFAIFHGGHKNMHKVEVVKKAPRYTMGSFWDDREESDYPQEERDRWAKELAETRALQKEQQKDWQDVREKGQRLSPYGTLYPESEV
jgi:2OG-Fe(II) oxygenase superfamily